jgi:transcriptional regulator with XRE-family HTH domain
MTPKDFNTAIGRLIRDLRQIRGLNQAAVGRAIGVSYQQISKGEAGTNAFSAFQLSRLAGLLDIHIADLYERAGESTGVQQPTAAEHDSYLAARYVAKIADPKLRGSVVDFTRKLAYNAGAAA